MNQFCLLWADNMPESLELYSEFFRESGYHVLTATNAEEARLALRQRRIHLAVLDMRLEREEDDKDMSGYNIARTEAPGIPKIILTAWPSLRDAVQSLKGSVPPAVEYLTKPETSLEALQTAVQQALTQYSRINWQLTITWQTLPAFLQMAQWLCADAAPLATFGTGLTDLPERAAELEDLFRKLFYDYAQITIGPALTFTPEHFILPVYAFTMQGVESRHIVSCGLRTAVQTENSQYEKLVPQRFGIKNIGKLHTAETARFAAIAYTFMGDDLAASQTLRFFSQNRPAAEVTAVIHSLYAHNLAAWYETAVPHPENNLLTFAQTWLHLPPPAETAAHIRRMADIVAAQTGRVTNTNTALHFHLDGETLTLPHPALWWEGAEPALQGEAAWGVTHGRVNTDSILVDRKQQVWLLDFAGVNWGPLVADFVMLETAVTHDLFQPRELHQACALQQQLWQPLQLDDPIATSDLPPEAIYIISLVNRVRQEAARLAGCDWRAYQEMAYLCCVARLLSLPPQPYYTGHTLTGWLHLLVATAVLTPQLSTIPAPITTGEPGLRLDEVNKSVWVEGQQIELTTQEYDIMAYLYAHAGQLCERHDIVEKGLQEPYDYHDPEQSRLNSAMSRLRRKIEPDTRQPRYLMTVHGRGYRLYPDGLPS
ncbi:MAG: DNA-binding response regulator [Anaerolineae bacterium]|nr:DNA-binding response regulator [Anaerolineae bacterium]